MRRINFDNKSTDDDIKLLALLKEQVDAPSGDLVNKTMEKWIESKQRKKYFYTPLRIPIYMMSVVLSLLFVPLFFPIESTLEGPEINFSVDTIVAYSLYAWLTITLILVFSTASRISLKLSLKIFNV